MGRVEVLEATRTAPNSRGRGKREALKMPIPPSRKNTSLMLFKSEVGERTQTEIPVFEREVRQPLHIVTTQPPEVVQTG